MNRDRFVSLSLLAFAMVITGFITRGMSRIFVGPDIATLIAAPLLIGGFGLIVALTLLAGLARLGIGPLAA